VSLPPRHYDLAARLLAAAVRHATDTGTPVAEALTEAARGHGHELGRRARQEAGTRPDRADLVDAALAVLEEHGYEPRALDGEVALANCPFHALAEEQRALTCGMNHDLLRGLADAVGDDVLDARLEPSDGYCCVRLACRPLPSPLTTRTVDVRGGPESP
jgi:predicted ArsR family transcriptional regulator